MKKYLFIFILLITSSVVSFAQAEQQTDAANAPAFQPKMTPEELAGKQAKMYEKRLALKLEQYKSIYDIELDYWTQYQKIRKSISEPDPNMLAQLAADRNEEIKKTLTPEQAKKFEASLPNSVHKAQPLNQPPAPMQK